LELHLTTRAFTFAFSNTSGNGTNHTIPANPSFYAFADSNCTLPWQNATTYELPPVNFDEHKINASCFADPANATSIAYNCSQNADHTSFDYFYYRNQDCSSLAYDHLQIDTSAGVFDCVSATLSVVRAGITVVTIPLFAQLVCPAGGDSSSNRTLILAIALGAGGLVLIIVVTLILYLRKKRKEKTAAEEYNRL